MDLVVRCDRFTHPGETLFAESLTEIPGGKGANQAVAAARAGAQTTMIGCVGNDGFAHRLKQNLVDEQINVDCVQSRSGSSGVAVIAVNDHAENMIYVVPGANKKLTPADVRGFREQIESADVLLLQLEIPIATVIEAVAIARRVGVTTVLDPAPISEPLPDELLNVDILCPNQVEASTIASHPLDTLDDAYEVVSRLLDFGVKQAVITLGSQGAVIANQSEITHIQPHNVEPVDTTAAGDAFAGALATRIALGHSFESAIRFANAAGALASAKAGAQPAMPTDAEIMRLLQS